MSTVHMIAFKSLMQKLGHDWAMSNDPDLSTVVRACIVADNAATLERKTTAERGSLLGAPQTTLPAHLRQLA